MTCLHHLGMSVGHKGARRAVDRLRKTYDNKVLEWKATVEVRTHARTHAYTHIIYNSENISNSNIPDMLPFNVSF